MVASKRQPRLNSYSDEDLKRLLASYEEDIKKHNACDVWSEPLRSARWILSDRWSRWEWIALIRIAIGQPAQCVREAFTSGARDVVTWFDLHWRRREEFALDPQIQTEEKRSLRGGEAVTYSPLHANPWDYMTGLMLAVLGVAREERERFMMMNQAMYGAGANKTGDEHVGLRVEIARALLSGNEDKARQLNGVFDDVARRCQDEYDPGTLHPRDISCLLNADGTGLAERLGKHLALHKHWAKRGPFRKAPEGLACIGCLFTARLAVERGMHVDIRDPYLPLWVVDERVDREEWLARVCAGSDSQRATGRARPKPVVRGKVLVIEVLPEEDFKGGALRSWVQNELARFAPELQLDVVVVTSIQEAQRTFETDRFPLALAQARVTIKPGEKVTPAVFEGEVRTLLTWARESRLSTRFMVYRGGNMSPEAILRCYSAHPNVVGGIPGYHSDDSMRWVVREMKRVLAPHAYPLNSS